MFRDRPELTMRAVDESVRQSPSVCSTLRIVHEDVKCDGDAFPAGTFTFVSTSATKRDPGVYDESDRFDITREAPPTILTVGVNSHRRVAANLARVELASSLDVLAHRMLRMRASTSLTAESGE